MKHSRQSHWEPFRMRCSYLTSVMVMGRMCSRHPHHAHHPATVHAPTAPTPTQSRMLPFPFFSLSKLLAVIHASAL